MYLASSFDLVQLDIFRVLKTIIFCYDQSHRLEVPRTMVQGLIPIRQTIELYRDKVGIYPSPDYIPRGIPCCFHVRDQGPLTKGFCGQNPSQREPLRFLLWILRLLLLDKIIPLVILQMQSFQQHTWIFHVVRP